MELINEEILILSGESNEIKPNGISLGPQENACGYGSCSVVNPPVCPQRKIDVYFSGVYAGCA